MQKRTITVVALLWLATILPQALRAQSPSDAEKAQALMEQGAALMYREKADLAEPLLRQAVALSPSSALAFYYLGSVEMTLNKYASAREAIQTALKLDEATPGLVRKQRRDAQDILAVSYYYQKQYDKARAAYQEAMAMDPLYPGFPYNLACVCALVGDRPAALSALRGALANDAKADSGPSLPDPAADEDLKGLWGEPAFLAILIANQGHQPNDGPGGGMAREGARRLAAGDPAGAAELLKSSLQIDPNMVRGWFLLGGALEAQGNGPDAAEAYRKALALNVVPRAVLAKPSIRYGALRSGQAFLSAGKPAEALEAFKAGTRADDYYAPLHYELARAYAGTDDKALAESSLKRAVVLEDQLCALDPPLPDPTRDVAFAKWAKDGAWLAFVGSLR